MHFHEWNILYFDSNFIEVCSWGSNWQYSSIGSDNGLAPIRRQAIIWTNAEQIHWDELISYNQLGQWQGDALSPFLYVSLWQGDALSPSLFVCLWQGDALSPSVCFTYVFSLQKYRLNLSNVCSSSDLGRHMASVLSLGHNALMCADHDKSLLISLTLWSQI